MTKVVIRTDDVEGFFARAKDAARRADRGQAFEGKVTLSFEDPQRMFTVLSEARRRLMLEVMHEPRTINELTHRLHRNRSAITKDVRIAGKGRGCSSRSARSIRARHPEDGSFGGAQDRDGGNSGLTVSSQ